MWSGCACPSGKRNPNIVDAVGAGRLGSVFPFAEQNNRRSLSIVQRYFLCAGHIAPFLAEPKVAPAAI
jgi:hypothetical protein